MKKLREKKGLTIEALAAKAGLCVSTAGKAERGGKVTPRTLAKIAKALGCKVEALK
jgi:transcriptional regulator with XRE-family HTH domain